MGRRRAEKDKGKGEGKAKGPRVGDRPLRQVSLRAFVHATEDPQRVREALAFVAGYDLGESKQAQVFEKELEESTSQGHFRNPISILELPLRRSAQVRAFWRRVLETPEVRGRLASDVERRLDEELSFWFRLDKQEAARGRLSVADGQDVVLVRTKVATYPKDRDAALGFLQRLFGEPDPKGLL